MNQSLLSIAILLSVGSVGCAGFGVQQSSSLLPRAGVERGLDSLWQASEDAPSRGIEPPIYAERDLGTLWNRSADAPRGVADPLQGKPRGADLWNPAPVARSWEAVHSETPLRGISSSNRRAPRAF